MPSDRRQALVRYTLACGIVLVVILLKAGVPWLGTPAPFLLMSIAVAVAAWLTGPWFGVAIAVAADLAVYLLFVDAGTDGVGGPVIFVTGLADFVLMALAAARLRAALREESESRSAAERATRGRDAFISTMAHELRNPLTAVIASSDLLARRLANDADARAQATTIGRQARRASTLVGDLLDASRFDIALVHIASDAVDLAAVARAAAASFAPQLDGSHTLVADIVETAPVTGDAMRLEQVFVNLLDNARKYSPRDGTIELSVAVEGSDAVARVSDRGIGISDAEARRLFEPFYRAHPSEGAGLGLGLHIAQAIVGRHGGELSYAPRDGGGATFAVRLPLRAATVTDTTLPRAVSATAPGSTGAGQPD